MVLFLIEISHISIHFFSTWVLLKIPERSDESSLLKIVGTIFQLVHLFLPASFSQKYINLPFWHILHNKIMIGCNEIYYRLLYKSDIWRIPSPPLSSKWHNLLNEELVTASKILHGFISWVTSLFIFLLILISLYYLF